MKNMKKLLLGAIFMAIAACNNALEAYSLTTQWVRDSWNPISNKQQVFITFTDDNQDSINVGFADKLLLSEIPNENVIPNGIMNNIWIPSQKYLEELKKTLVVGAFQIRDNIPTLSFRVSADGDKIKAVVNENGVDKMLIKSLQDKDGNHIPGEWVAVESNIEELHGRDQISLDEEREQQELVDAYDQMNKAYQAHIQQLEQKTVLMAQASVELNKQIDQLLTHAAGSPQREVELAKITQMIELRKHVNKLGEARLNELEARLNALENPVNSNAAICPSPEDMANRKKALQQHEQNSLRIR